MNERELIEKVKQMQAECAVLLAELAALKASKLKVDDKVMVRMGPEDDWKKRYFSRFDENGAIFCFGYGMTSWSLADFDNSASHWNEWRLPTEDEL